MLNRGQQEALELAREGHNLLIMGSAGTGKSHVLTEIFDNLTEEGKKVQLTCSTGIACTIYKTRYNAVTIHQFSGIEDGRYDPDKILTVLKNTAKADRVIRNIMSTDVLIVDECSMISQRTFNSLCNVCSMKDPSKLC
ncbi:MAG: AAA family ATPase, partial [Candidatus Thiodiazotropha taylori]|nr:AAA family ATPase [Candidatus Thiodiazotropha taylori]MCW4335717.1 AAA family ATPase [Candidatus Thiodiazotropha endolucinida]